AYNDLSEAQSVTGHVVVTDFFERTVSESDKRIGLAARSGNSLQIVGPASKQGFFRAAWSTSDSTQSVRYVVTSPLSQSPENSPFGMNHAYPWDFLVRSAREAGVVWWRDWSAKWDTVEHKQGQFNF